MVTDRKLIRKGERRQDYRAFLALVGVLYEKPLRDTENDEMI